MNDDDNGDETLHSSLLSARLRYRTCHGTARTLRVIPYPSIVKKGGGTTNDHWHFVREKWVAKSPLCFTTSGCHCQTTVVGYGARRPTPKYTIWQVIFQNLSQLGNPRVSPSS
jgi:hypothetical protein